MVKRRTQKGSAIEQESATNQDSVDSGLDTVSRPESAPAPAPALTVPTAPTVSTPTNPISIAIRDRVLTNFVKRLTADPVVITTLSENGFSKLLSALSYDTVLKKNPTDLYDLTQHVQNFQGSALQANIGDIIKEGGFGKIYKHKTDPTRIIKQITFEPDEQTKQDFFNNALREVFIQFYLYNTTLGNVPQIYSFAKEDVSVLGYFYIEMQYLQNPPWMDIYDYFDELLSQGKKINFDRFSEILLNVCTVLNTLEEKTSFVHRDFKLNNIMINKQTFKIIIIDFGYTTIRIPNISGEDYIINSYQPAYKPDAPVRFQQDLGMFLIFFRQYYINTGYIQDRIVRSFMNNIIPASIRTLSSFRQAYNVNGSVFASYNTEILTPKNVINAINEFKRLIQEGVLRGGSALITNQSQTARRDGSERRNGKRRSRTIKRSRMMKKSRRRSHKK